MRYLFGLFLILLLIVCGAWIYSGRLGGPSIDIAKPASYIGQSATLDVSVTAPAAKLKTLRIVFEQNGRQTALFSLDAPAGAQVTQQSGDRVRITRAIGRDTLPDLKSGAARIVVTASRPVLRGFRTIETTVTRNVQVRLDRPILTVLSTKHYINLGGSEMVVYKVTPADVESGVQVGDLTYPGYPASGADGVDGVHITDPSIRLAFFALRFDQDLNTPMHLYARDPAGNTARADFDYRVFPKPFKRSRIRLDDRFLDRVVPAILATTSEVKPEGSTLDKFLVINGELRRKNAAKIASFAGVTSPKLLWGGAAFHPYTNSAVEAAFADQRTYVYQGKDVDQQVHLGFDLAKVVHSHLVAANRGKVVYAAPLGIYGNCVIIDHGMGVQSLYGHLSSIGVQVGQMVDKEQEIGRTGETGLAGGDHLHFTMLVNGEMVNPVEWWDAHWIQDRILRKLHEAR
ncbi:MAG TPA: M23 family metallopeptidase [Vicinamibacterales bacterium]|nr:M23 family metallopeptidase [Vicinamibacterales bacterium]